MAGGENSIVDLDADSFRQGAVERSWSQPVVVDFHAGWCGPCQTQGPILEEVVRELNGAVVLAHVSVDQAPDLAASYGVRSVPTLIGLVDGEVVDELAGAATISQLRSFVAGLAEQGGRG
jgi:thioredoxin